MKLVWDRTGEHFYETGTDHGVIYPIQPGGGFNKGVAWNGLSTVTESPSGAELTPIYADNIKYLNLMSVEEFAATIEAYTYPPEFAECNGEAELVKGVHIGQQPRKMFCFCYRTLIGNDTEGDSLGYKQHLIYNCLAAPSEKAYSTKNESPEAVTFSWEVSTTPVEVTGHKPSASLEIDSREVDSYNLKKLEDILYGTADTDPRMPMPDEVLEIINAPLPTTISTIFLPLICLPPIPAQLRRRLLTASMALLKLRTVIVFIRSQILRPRRFELPSPKMIIARLLSTTLAI